MRARMIWGMWLSTAMLLTLIVGVPQAQAAPQPEVCGRVVDTSGNPVEGALVSAYSNSYLSIRSRIDGTLDYMQPVTTDANGDFCMGPFNILTFHWFRAQKGGVSNVINHYVSSSSTTIADLVLTPAPFVEFSGWRWDDANSNGVQDPGEGFKSGYYPVNIYRTDGVLPKEASGVVRNTIPFELDGTYYLEMEPLPAGVKYRFYANYTYPSPAMGTLDPTLDSTKNNIQVEAPIGSSYENFDWGVAPTSVKCGRIALDVDGDSNYDPQIDTGIANYQFTWNSINITTDANGFYCVPVPPTYNRIDTPFTNGPYVRIKWVYGAETDLAIDLMRALKFTINSRIFYSGNNQGSDYYGSNTGLLDTALSGFTVTYTWSNGDPVLDIGGNPIPPQQLVHNGPNVANAATITVLNEQKGSIVSTISGAPSDWSYNNTFDTDSESRPVTSSTTTVSNNWSYWSPQGWFTGKIEYRWRAGGIPNTPADGIEVGIVDSLGTSVIGIDGVGAGPTTTLADGTWEIADLPYGKTYSVSPTSAPQHWHFVPAYTTPGYYTGAVSATSALYAHRSWYLEPDPVNVSGKIFRDWNSNGVQDPDEPDVSGKSVLITRSDGQSVGQVGATGSTPSLVATTDANGNWSLQLFPLPEGVTYKFAYLSSTDELTTPRFYEANVPLGAGTFTVDAFGQKPNFGLSIVKTADVSEGGYVKSGTNVTWTYTVTNTGGDPLTNVVVTDDKLGQVCAIASLAPGATDSCTANGVV